MRNLALSLMITTLCGLLPCRASAALRALGEGELASVTGRAGVSIDLDLGLKVSIGSFAISDTSSTPNWLTFKGITIDDGAGGNFLVKSSDGLTINPTTFDVATDASGASTLVISDSSRMNPRYYSIDSINFVGQDLGSLQIGPVSEGPSVLALSALGTGSGVQFDYTTSANIGAFRYGYNSAESLTFSGIHLFGTPTGAPEDPTRWGMTGNFHIGTASPGTDAPASFSVATDQNGVTSSYLNLPMQGSIRVENLSFGDTNFGPMAIDGIHSHRLQIKFTP